MTGKGKERTTIELNPGDKAVLQEMATILGFAQTRGDKVGRGSISGLMQAIAAGKIRLETSHEATGESTSAAVERALVEHYRLRPEEGEGKK